MFRAYGWGVTTAGGTLIYDGDCAFCTQSARWIATRWAAPGPVMVAYQQLGDDGLGRIGLTRRDVEQAAWWVDTNGHCSRGHEAIARSLLAAQPVDRVIGRALLIPPISWIARPGYWLVARNRHRMPGATDDCKL